MGLLYKKKTTQILFYCLQINNETADVALVLMLMLSSASLLLLLLIFLYFHFGHTLYIVKSVEGTVKSLLLPLLHSFAGGTTP